MPLKRGKRRDGNLANIAKLEIGCDTRPTDGNSVWGGNLVVGGHRGQCTDSQPRSLDYSLLRLKRQVCSVASGIASHRHEIPVSYPKHRMDWKFKVVRSVLFCFFPRTDWSRVVSAQTFPKHIYPWLTCTPSQPARTPADQQIQTSFTVLQWARCCFLLCSLLHGIHRASQVKHCILNAASSCSKPRLAQESATKNCRM